MNDDKMQEMQKTKQKSRPAVFPPMKLVSKCGKFLRAPIVV